MIARRATVAAPRTLAARIAKLETYRPMTEEKQALVAELMDLLKRRKRTALLKPVIAKMLKANNQATSGRGSKL